MTQPDAEFLEKHAEYLLSADWAVRRSAVLDRDRHVCQANLAHCTHRATQVHHLTYRHWRNEPLFDLQSVCESCHSEITRMDRGEMDAIIAEQESRHHAFLTFWNAEMAARLKRSA